MPIYSGSSANAETRTGEREVIRERHVEREERDRDPRAIWAERTRVVLSPVAAPSILGLFGFATGTAMVASILAGWWGNGHSMLVIFPFAMTAGGIAQFLAGMWAYKARDGLGTAMHGIWGSFWLAFGLLEGMVAAGVLPPSPLYGPNPAFAMWFVMLAVITGFGALASLAESIGLFSVLGTLAAGSGFYAASLFAGSHWCGIVAGYLFAFSALAAIYTASAFMLENALSRVVLPLGKLKKRANVPGAQAAYPIEYEGGMPGTKVGQ